MGADQKRVRSIFQAAVEDHAPDHWDDYLTDACRGEPEIRRRVEFLLRGHKQPNELLDDPEAAPVAPAQPFIGEAAGAIIGPYKLLEQIGEGGFGIVFMAEQTQPVRRKVALKVVKPGMDTRQVVARFEAERQALALMDHPNIAQIYDGGATESGRPFFVMELVRGIPITEFCDQQHLDVRERLELFVHVCGAVQHAHQRGIIHRDLKPSNVLVTRHDVTPVVKVIDFGIAKATGQQLTDKTLFTHFARMIGTPMYMSPEQAQMSGLDVDTRSDVYSLGVLLYELLTGHTPFDRERMHTVGYDEMIRIIREEEPVKPSTRISTLGAAADTAVIDRNSTPKKLSQLFRGELDWIVLKALEKDRNRRYESAGAFGSDVRRFLDGEVVQACPPTVGYRLRKSARRYKAALATAAIAFAALSIGAGFAVWQTVVATQAKQVALNAAAAEKNAKIAVEAKEAEAQAVVSFLENRVLSAARPEGEGGGLGHDVSLRRAIEAAAPFVQGGFKDQPLIEARLRMTLGYSFASLGEPLKSGEQFAAAGGIYAKMLGPDHETTLRSVLGVAKSYNASSRFADACQLCESTWARMRFTLGPRHGLTLKFMDELSTSYVGLGRWREALALREEAAEIRKASLGDEDLETVQSLHNLADSYSALGRHREALPIQEKVLAVRKAKLGPDHTDTLFSMNNLGNTYQSLDRPRDACTTLKEALALQKAKLGHDHPSTLITMVNLPKSYLRLGRGVDAIALYEEALPLFKARHGPDHAHTLYCMHNMALCYSTMGRHADALQLGEETVRRRKAALGMDHPDTLLSMNHLGVYLSAVGRHDESLAVHKETLMLRSARLGAAHPQTLTSLFNVAKRLITLDRGAEAVPYIDEYVKQASINESVKPGVISEVLMFRMRHFSKLRDEASCQATAAMLDAMVHTDADSLYNAACAHALVAQLIRDQDKSAAGENRAQAEANVAMDRLRKAVAAGYKNAVHMKKDSDLDAVRQRPDFIELLADLSAGAKPDKK